METCRLVLHAVPLMLSVKQGSCEYQFEIIGLTRLGIKPESTTAEADTLGTRPPELLPSPTGISGNQLKESLHFTDNKKVCLHQTKLEWWTSRLKQ